MKLGLPAGVDSPLGRRLVGLTVLRLSVLTAFLAIIELYYNRALPLGGYSSIMTVSLVAIAYAVSASYALVLRVGRWLDQVALLQLTTDQLTWTAVAYVSGGVTSGTTSLYALTCLSGAILLDTRGALVAALSAITGYTLLCAGFALRWWPPPPDQPADAYITDFAAMVYPAASTLLGVMLVTALAAYLAERVRAEADRVREATDRAERQLRLAAALAHEIRNPLGSIRGSVELLRTGSDLPTDDRRLCELIEREVERLNELVTDMLDLSRARPLDLTDTDLAALTQSVVDLAKRSGRGGDLKLRYDGPPSLRVRADDAQMRQVLWNLIRNAMQASGAGEEIRVTLKRDEAGSVIMSVSDDGPGLPDSARDHVFDAFFTTRSHGAGIGLAVVRQNVQAHGFDVTVASEEGKGATFIVRVPKSSVLAAIVLLTLAACAGQDWVRAPVDRDQNAEGAEWFVDSPAADHPPTEETPAASARGARPAPPPGPSLPSGADLEAGATSVDTYRNTYYDFPKEAPWSRGAPTTQLFDGECRPIATVSRDFYDRLCVQGSGRMLSGHTVSFAKRDCACAAECPRTGQKICFEKLAADEFPFGRGATGKAITPLRTVAVDPARIPLGSVLYIPAYHGLRGPDGDTHDGCFIAQDRGLKVQDKHVDIFTGDPETTAAWNVAVPSNQGVKVIVGVTRCRYLAGGEGTKSERP